MAITVHQIPVDFIPVKLSFKLTNHRTAFMMNDLITFIKEYEQGYHSPEFTELNKLFTPFTLANHAILQGMFGHAAPQGRPQPITAGEGEADVMWTPIHNFQAGIFTFRLMTQSSAISLVNFLIMLMTNKDRLLDLFIASINNYPNKYWGFLQILEANDVLDVLKELLAPTGIDGLVHQLKLQNVMQYDIPTN